MRIRAEEQGILLGMESNQKRCANCNVPIENYGKDLVWCGLQCKDKFFERYYNPSQWSNEIELKVKSSLLKKLEEKKGRVSVSSGRLSDNHYVEWSDIEEVLK